MKNITISVVGWYGVLAIILAYGLVSFDMITVKSFAYQLLNLSGAIAIIIEASSKKDIQPAVLNIIWAVVALIAILQML